MVFGCSDDMLELCPILSQTPFGDLCILQRQPKLLEASNLRPDFRKNVVSYPPPPPPNPYIFEKPVSRRFRKGKHTSTHGTTYFRNSACTGMHVQSVQPTLPQNRLFLTKVLAAVVGNSTYRGVRTQLKKL